VVALYVFRHGETDWNAAGRFQGRTDRSLTDLGRIQARAAGEVLKAELSRVRRRADEFAFVASPLKRARETMAILAETVGASGFATDPDLVELAFGAWEGMTSAEVKIAFAEARRARKRDRWTFRPEGGESFEDLEKRVDRWVGRINRPTIACTHAGVIRVLARQRLRLAADAAATWPVPHGGVFRIGDDTVEALPPATQQDQGHTAQS